MWWKNWIFSVTWSFTNHSNMLISDNIINVNNSSLIFLRKPWCTFFQDSLMNIILYVFSFDQFNAKKGHCKQFTKSVSWTTEFMNKSFRRVLFVHQLKRKPLLLFSQSRVFQWTTTYIWVCLSQKVIIWCVCVCNNTQVAVAADSRPAGLNESQPGEFHFHGSLSHAQTQSIIV